MGILDALAGMKKGAESDEDDAPESKPAEKTGYLTLMKESAADGDWDGFADAVAGYVKQCSMK